MEEDPIELGNLSSHVIESIFCRIPLKTLAKLECVSRHWRSFISRFRRSNPPTTPSGLILFLHHLSTAADASPYQSIIFIKHNNQGSFSTAVCSSFTHHGFSLVGSCGGLLLFASHDRFSWTYHLSVPFLDCKSDQHLIRLPPSHSISRPARASLAFDSDDCHCNGFTVVCFFWNEVDLISSVINSLIFSSKTWSWKEHQARILNGYFLQEDGFCEGQCFQQCVFHKGRLYWIWSQCMLVYDTNGEFFKLIPLPKDKSPIQNAYLYKLLWVSEDRLHLCQPGNHGLMYLWIYNDDQDEKECDDQNSNLMWKFTKVINWSSKMKPCAFNEDLQVLFFLKPPVTIFAYSFETQMCAQVWSSCVEEDQEEEDDYFLYGAVLPFLFSSVNSLAFQGFRRHAIIM